MLFRGAQVALPGKDRPEPLAIRVTDGRFAELAQGLRPLANEEVYDLGGLLVLPGGIDSHVHFDTPGFTEREDFLHGCAEAARGGITTVIDMPCTSQPPVTSVANLEHKRRYIESMALVDYGFYGGLCGPVPGEVLGYDYLEARIQTLAPYVLGFKAYLLSGMESFPRLNHEALSRAIHNCAAAGRPLLLHAEDADYVYAATERIRRRLGDEHLATWDDYVDSRPEEAELVAVAAAVQLAGLDGGTLHIVHVGTAAAALLAHEAGATCETCTHYLAFTRDDFTAKGASLKTAPPVKTARDRDLLWQYLADGIVDFVTSDHAPARFEEKRTGSVWTDYGGIPGVGTTYPYLLSEGYLANRLSLSRLQDLMSGAKARRFGLGNRKGSIAVGLDADFVVVDPAGQSVFKGESLLSKGKDTPFHGFALRGSIVGTWLRGRAVYLNPTMEQLWGRFINIKPGMESYIGLQGIMVAGGYGQWLRWN